MTPTFVVVDVETTGLDPRTDRVVEIAAVRVDERGEILGAESQLVNPDRPIPAEASAIHGITDEMVAGAPSLGEVITALRISSAAIIVAHNARFDVGFLAGPAGVASWADVPTICTYRCAHALIPDAPSHRNGVLRFHIGLQIPSWLGPRPPMHAAMPDAIVTARLLRHLLTLRSADELLSVSARVPILRLVSFGRNRGRPWADMDAGFLRWCLDPSRDFGEEVRRTARHHLGAGS